jgi:tetratricopeptide (TPR) repeat protein
MLGTALYEAGHAAGAEGQFRAVLERQPDSGPARLALVECLLSQSRWSDAVETARAVDETDTAAVAAARSEVFALLASERAADAGDALARARTLGLAHPEAEVLGAWCALARGEEPQGTLPLDSALLLGVVLEALLRVEAIDAFALLVPAVERLPLPWRARRELLAGIYLRRGFLESAADEWLAACERGGPDAEALLGLAQVALARGMSEDARTFAEEALALDPQGPLAPAAGKIVAAA